MLIHFTKCFVMEGEATLKKRRHLWNKPIEKRTKIYCVSFVCGLCASEELDIAIEKAIAEHLNTSDGWGINFSGWQRVVPYEEALEIYKEHGWDIEDLPSGNVRIEYVNQWKMNKILNTLNGEQFLQLCREGDFELSKIKESQK